MGSLPPQRLPRLRTRTARVATREMLGATKVEGRADCLVVIYGPTPADITRRYVLDPKNDSYDIGRSSQTNVTVDSTAVSRKHARVERIGNEWWLTDLGSLNGTYVNDVRIDRQRLVHADRIQIGDVIFKHLAGDDVEAAFMEAIRLALVTDGLTQAANDRAFRDAVHSAVARSRADQTPVSLIITDLDHFKTVNDLHGHPAGDRVLREFVRVVRRVCDPRVTVARVGGEEFALLVSHCAEAEAAAIAEKARIAVGNHGFSSPTGMLRLTASFGVAELHAAPDDETQLFARADARLYEAKRGGRNRVAR